MGFKNIIAGFLFLLMGFQVSNSLFTVAFYEIEKSFILKELCVQRALMAEENTCQGQCFLMKQLRETETKSENLAHILKEFKVLLFQEGRSLFPLSIAFNYTLFTSFFYLQKPYSKAVFDIFHPPRVAKF